MPPAAVVTGPERNFIEDLVAKRVCNRSATAMVIHGNDNRGSLDRVAGLVDDDSADLDTAAAPIVTCRGASTFFFSKTPSLHAGECILPSGLQG